jgi:hypothetical protein
MEVSLMKLRLWLTLLSLVLITGLPAVAQDGGNPDTVIIMTSRPDAGSGTFPGVFIVEVWAYDDVDGLTGIQGAFSWVNDNLTADSATISPAAGAVWNSVIYWEGNNMATSNANNRVNFSAFGIFGGTLPPSASRQLLLTYYFTLSSWSAGDSILVDTTSWDFGSELLFTNASGDWTPLYGAPWGPIKVLDPSDVTSNSDILPTRFALNQNYPNPFNPTTTIGLDLPVASHVKLTVYNVLGQQVNTLIDEELVAGSHTVEWDGTTDSGDAAATGVYFYRIDAGDFVETRKMMLLK